MSFLGSPASAVGHLNARLGPAADLEIFGGVAKTTALESRIPGIFTGNNRLPERQHINYQSRKRDPSTLKQTVAAQVTEPKEDTGTTCQKATAEASGRKLQVQRLAQRLSSPPLTHQPLFFKVSLRCIMLRAGGMGFDSMM